MDYNDFLQQKQIVNIPTGYDPGPLNVNLKDFQRDITRWAIRLKQNRSIAALFLIHSGWILKGVLCLRNHTEKAFKMGGFLIAKG